MSDYKVIFITMTNYNQLSSDGKEISWIDNTPTRFQMYSTLTDDDYAIIRGSGNQKSVYIGKIKNTTINSNEVNLVISIKEEFYINGDKLLCVNEISPEFQSQMKAHFKPYISERPIDIDKVINELKNENYIDFYIINTNHSNFQGLLKQIKQNDRIVFYGKEFQNFYIANDFNREGAFPADAFSSKGKTLDDLVQIFNQMSKADKQKSKNVAVLEKIKDSIVKDGVYKFNSFAYYWNIIHNKSAGNKLLMDDEEDKMKNYIVDDMPLNTILYGPPGTGKTYQTIEKAIRIVNPGFIFPDTPYSQDDRKIVKDEYNRLYGEGKIIFTSFHQSLSYEDFIEGIKPALYDQELQSQDDDVKTNDEKIKYTIEPGIFRNICEAANQKKKNISRYDFDEAKIEYNKMSLGNTQKDDENIFEYCINNKVIALGYGGNIDYSDVKNKDDIKKLLINKDSKINKFSWEAVDRFKNVMKKDEIIMISKGNKYIRAIGRINGEYYYDENTPIRYNHFRKVEWLYTDTLIPVNQILNNKNLSQQTIYQFYKKDINVKYIKSLLSFADEEIEKEKYVLIIDEINRGNVSQIFGELITLIEEDKRAGNSEALKIILPYSKEPFTVPSNLYIIGTMNTADRSVEALDTALRRRFSFEFMPPMPELVPMILGDLKLRKVFEEINKRITYLLDEDHQIGHSYFMSIENEDGLRHVFRNKIIPLLKEYFYNDFGKIRLILGDQFVKLMPDNARPRFAVSDGDLPEKEQYRIMLDDDNFDIITALKQTIENIS